MLPRIARVGASRARTAGHLDARSGRRGRRAAAALRARPVHHALRLRRRRGADQHQRRPGRSPRASCTPIRAVGTVTEALDAARGRATRSGCAARSAPPGRSPTAMAATWSSSPAASAWRRCGRRSTSLLAERERVRQAGAAVRHARPGGHPVPRRARELAAAARHRDRGHRRSRRRRLARPCRRGDQADPARSASTPTTPWPWCAGRR